MPRKARAHPKPTRRPTFLRAWRKHRGMTLARVSEALELLHDMELSDSQLSRIENGKQPYSQDLLEALAELYRIDVASLLMRDPEAKFWSVYDTLDAPERKQVDDYVEFVLNRKAG